MWARLGCTGCAGWKRAHCLDLLTFIWRSAPCFALSSCVCHGRLAACILSGRWSLSFGSSTLKVCVHSSLVAEAAAAAAAMELRSYVWMRALGDFEARALANTREAIYRWMDGQDNNESADGWPSLLFRSFASSSAHTLAMSTIGRVIKLLLFGFRNSPKPDSRASGPAEKRRRRAQSDGAQSRWPPPTPRWWRCRARPQRCASSSSPWAAAAAAAPPHTQATQVWLPDARTSGATEGALQRSAEAGSAGLRCTDALTESVWSSKSLRRPPPVGPRSQRCRRRSHLAAAARDARPAQQLSAAGAGHRRPDFPHWISDGGGVDHDANHGGRRALALGAVGRESPSSPSQSEGAFSRGRAPK